VRPIMLTERALKTWPLPHPPHDGDKEDRGRILVLGGSKEMPGGVILASTAALRAGAGKLRIGTTRSISQAVAIAIPESRVFALPETKSGGISPSAATLIIKHAAEVDALLVGPGMLDERASVRLFKTLLPSGGNYSLVLDAAALAVLRENSECLRPYQGRAVLTPHAGEMAHLLGVSKEEVEGKRSEMVVQAARRFDAVVVLKGRETLIASPGGELLCNRTGNVGLATSGSGDVLAGVVAGLLARGAPPLHAAAWGVFLHGRAGDVVAKTVGQLGFLASELLAVIPALMTKPRR
jgi:ADP-dependent NAD(P)H-hydrate dehydratase